MITSHNSVFPCEINVNLREKVRIERYKHEMTYSFILCLPETATAELLFSDTW